MTIIAPATFLESLEGWSAIAVAVVGVLALGGTVLTLRQNRNDSKRARALDYLRRLFGLDFAPLHMQVLTYLGSADKGVFLDPEEAILGPSSKPKTDTEADAAYDSLNLEQRANVFLVFNFYEELSGSYRAGLLDDKIAQRMLLSPILETWNDAAWFVEVARRRTKMNYEGMGYLEDAAERAGEAVLSEWEGLAKEIRADQCRPTPREWLDNRAWGGMTYFIALAAALGAVGLAEAALGSNGFRDLAASFLFATAAVCLAIAIVAIALPLASSPTRRAALVSLALAGTLSIGTSVTLALRASRGPQGVRGAMGKQGPEGMKGKQGETGPEGKPGPEGEPGAHGKRGKQGERGPRGYPGFPDL